MNYIQVYNFKKDVRKNGEFNKCSEINLGYRTVLYWKQYKQYMWNCSNTRES